MEKNFGMGLINFDHFINWGVISPNDVDLFKIVDSVNDALIRLHRH